MNILKKNDIVPVVAYQIYIGQVVDIIHHLQLIMVHGYTLMIIRLKKFYHRLWLNVNHIFYSILEEI